MTSEQASVDARQLIERMNSIRNASESHVADLHQEAHRLVDWREHGRARPLLAVAAAATIGYSVMHKSRARKGINSESHNAAVATAGVSTGVMALVGSLASSAIRQYAMHKFRSFAK